MKIWLDDVRSPPDITWVWLKSAVETLEMFRLAARTNESISVASFDCHLGGAPSKLYDYLAPSGVQLLRQMKQENLSPMKLIVHTDDSIKGAEMITIARSFMECEIVRRPEMRAL